jgi:hypothetical protein
MKAYSEAIRENGIRSKPLRRLLAPAACLFLAAGVGVAQEAETGDAAVDADQPPVSYYRPLGESSRAVLIAPGLDESEEAWVPLADSLRRSGFHVVIAGLGAVQAPSSSRPTRVASAAIDAREALCYLRDLPGVPVRAITLVGSGSGCSAVLDVGEIAFETCSYIFLSPSGDWQDWRAGGSPGVGECSILVTTAADDLLSLEASAAILRDVPQQECWVVDGRGRGVELLRSRPDLISRLTAWIVRAAGESGEER